jgi:hypothetical protein
MLLPVRQLVSEPRVKGQRKRPILAVFFPHEYARAEERAAARQFIWDGPFGANSTCLVSRVTGQWRLVEYRPQATFR